MGETPSRNFWSESKFQGLTPSQPPLVKGRSEASGFVSFALVASAELLQLWPDKGSNLR